MIGKFTIEEIMLIRSCNTKDKDKAIRILDSYVTDVDPAMAETIQDTIAKLKGQSQEEYLEAADYPI